MTLRRAGHLLMVFFFLSGVTALIYEVLWMRMLTLIFGTTSLAVSTVLSAFMAGLALGSFLSGRFIDKRAQYAIVAYGLLEIIIGLWAMGMPVFLHWLPKVYGGLFLSLHAYPYLFNIIRFALSFLILLLPTTCMGATLPVISKFFVKRVLEVSTKVGALYGLNTLGATFGSFAAGFYLIGYLGLHLTSIAASAGNLLIGLGTLAVARTIKGWEGPSPSTVVTETEATEGEVPLTKKLLLIVMVGFGLSGFASLAYEVLWTRLLLFVFYSGVYAFSTVLTTFLAGIAIGSFIAARSVSKKGDQLLFFALIEMALGLFGLLSIPMLANFIEVVFRTQRLISSFFGVSSWPLWVVNSFLDASVFLLLPTLLMGATFPLVCKLCLNQLKKVGRGIGDLYSVNTLGALGGSFAGGFVLMPLLGTQGGITFVAILNLAIGSAVLLSHPQRSLQLRVAGASLCLCVALLSLILIPDEAFVGLFNQRVVGSQRVAYYKEGPSGTVSVHEHAHYKTLNINGTGVAGTSFAFRSTQKMQGHIPLLLHKNPKRVLQVGLGSGETTKVVLLHGVEKLDVAEINPDVVEAARIYFKEINGGVLEEPRPKNLEIIITDAKNYLLLTDEKYDIIMNDSIHPKYLGAAWLYTKEYFLSCKERLRDGGLMTSWLPITGLKEKDLKMVLGTFQSVFPNATLWLGNNCINANTLLIGQKGEGRLQIDFELIQERLKNPEIRKDLEEIRLSDVYALLDCFMLDDDIMRRFTQSSLINTDQHPYLEFSAPKTWAPVELVVGANLERLINMRRSVFPLLHFSEDNSHEVNRRLGSYFRATHHLLKGQLFEIIQQPQLAKQEYQQALSINPDDRDAGQLLKELALKSGVELSN